MSNNTMRQSTTTTVSTRNAANNESDFDALLEDLQATVSRSNSMRGGALNGGVTTNVSGYREVRRTVKDDATGESTTEYQIEYLHPANSTTHVAEYSTSPYYNHTGYGVAGQHNKEITYKYNTSSQTKGDWSSGRSRGSDAEIEELLQDFQTPVYTQNQSDRYQTGVLSSQSGGFDHVPGAGRSQEERRYREERRETKSSGSSSLGPGGVKRELVFTGPRSRDPSPISYHKGQQPLTQQVYRYEKTTSTKTIGPDGTVLYDSGGLDGGKRSTQEDVRTMRSPSPQYLQYRETSPARHVDTVKYTTSTPNQPAGGYSVKQSSYTYNTSSSNHQETRDIPQSPPPHRSPSPVAFAQPPTPVRSSVSRTTTANYSYDVPSSPTLGQKFSPSDPSRTTLTYNVSPPQQPTPSYKYTTVTTTSNKYSDQDTIPSKPRPFPNPSPTPDQQPPKKIDELMASFGDVESHDTVDGRHRVHTVRTETTTSSSSSRKKDEGYPGPGHAGPGHPRDPAKPAETQPLVDQRKEETRNITGPPVYYPKGELFAKKEESMVQRESAGGGGKYKAKAKYQYESGSKYKESSDTKVVPVCIPCPCCCAAPCTIM